jgi:hypothetical protein
MTAVEWLQEALSIHLTFEQQMQFEGLFQQAKEMEKQQGYSEEEVYNLMDKRETFWVRYKNTYSQNYISLKEWFEQFKNK